MTGIALILACTSAFAADAQEGLGIAAVVSGDPISSYDVDSRIKFIIATANLSNTPDVIARIRPQIMRTLLDEKLQLQEAKKLDIKVTDDDVKKAIAGIEAERNMPPGAIDHIMEINHVPKDTFTHQIRAQLAWNKLLAQKIRPHVKVSDEEIATALQRIATQPVKPAKGPQELKIAVITLPVDKPSRAAEVKKLADKLVKEVRGGASFEEVSRQFSSAAAGAGGKVESFWVKPGQLDLHVNQALANADKGTVTDPVPTSEGFTIIKVYDTRAIGPAPEPEIADSDVTLKEILLKLKPDAPNKEAAVLLQIGEDVAKHPGGCQDKSVAGVDNPEEIDIAVDFRTQRMSALPGALRTIAQSLKIGEISTPFASDEGIRLYMLCDKKDIAAGTPDREQVYRMLMQQKMELEAQKYLRNLRRETFIEVR